MKLTTLRTTTADGSAATVAARVEGDSLVTLPRYTDVGAVLRAGALDVVGQAGPHDGETLERASADLAPVVTNPGKIICAGLNYTAHIREMKRDLPEHPTLFAKFADCLLGGGDDIQLPPESGTVDWEGELAVVIGSRVRRASADEARSAIAGYSVCNDISMRDWQFRTKEWLQGKMWADSTPLGPVLATPDEIPADARLTTLVDGVEKQSGDIHGLVHDPVHLVRYVSTILPLNPGDVIITGTPGGVGHARSPQEYLRAGQTVTVRIDGIGELTNRTVAEQVP